MTPFASNASAGAAVSVCRQSYRPLSAMGANIAAPPVQATISNQRPSTPIIEQTMLCTLGNFRRKCLRCGAGHVGAEHPHGGRCWLPEQEAVQVTRQYWQFSPTILLPRTAVAAIPHDPTTAAQSCWKKTAVSPPYALAIEKTHRSPARGALKNFLIMMLEHGGNLFAERAGIESDLIRATVRSLKACPTVTSGKAQVAQDTPRGRPAPGRLDHREYGAFDRMP